MEATKADPENLSRLELVSLFVNGYYDLGPEARFRFEAEFKKRGLPLPHMPPRLPAPAVPAKKTSTIDRSCFTSYMLLIYTGTAIFYAWIFLAARLIKLDFGANPRHKLIQTAIALFYVVAELLAINYFAGLD